MDFNAAIKDKPEIKSDIPVSTDPFDPLPLIKGFDEFRGKISEMVEQAEQHTVSDDQTNETAVAMTTQAKLLSQTIEKKRVELKEPYLKVTKVLDGETKTLKDGLSVVQNILNSKIEPYLQEKERIRQAEERKAREAAEAEQKRLEDEARKQAEADAQARYEVEKAERERLLEEQQKAADADEAERLKKASIEEEKRLKQEADQRAKEEAEAAAALTPEIVTDVPATVKTLTDVGSADLKKSWTWEIADFSKLSPGVFEARKEQIIKAMAPYFNAQVKAGIRNIPGVRIYEKSTLNTRVK